MKLHNWIILVLVLIVICQILFQRPKPESDLVQRQTAVIERQKEIISELKTDNGILQAKIDRDSVRSEANRIAHQEVVKKDRAAIARLKANPVVVRIREENPGVDSLIKAQDEAIKVRDERIGTLEHDNSELRVDMNRMKANFNGIIEAQSVQLSAQTEISKDLRKQVRRERREKRLAIVGGIVLTVGALFVQ